MLPRSNFHKPRNATEYWQDNDSREAWAHSGRHDYTETSITYTYNSAGFRTREFELTSTRPRVMFFGCSHVEGIGLRVEDTWVDRVSQQFNHTHDCYNLGVGGSSIDNAVMQFGHCLGPFTPTIAFILYTDSARMDMYHMNNWNSTTGTDVTIKNMAVFDEFNLYNLAQKNKLLMRTLAALHGVTLVELDLSEDFYPVMLPHAHSRARDNHLGPVSHAQLASMFLERYHSLTDKTF